AEKVVRRDHERGWGLRENPGRLGIRTVDSFCDSIVARAPYAAGMGRTQRAIDDAADLYRDAARRTLKLLAGGDGVAEAVATVLKRLDNNVNRFERLMQDMLGRREQWMRLFGEQLTDDSDPEAARRELERALADTVAFELQRVRDLLDQFLDPHERVA